MRKIIVAAMAALFLCTGTIGCKTAAKMAWWKTGDKANVESTALAHSAPALPADVAKQAESYATSAPSIQMSGGEAAPYSTAPAYSPDTASQSTAPANFAGAGAAAYPSTGALPYSATPTRNPSPSVAASTPTAAAAYASADRSADLGEVEMPYDPAAVPPARTIVAAPTPASGTPTDRYAMASTPPAYDRTATPSIAVAAVPPSSGGDRYGNFQNAPAPQFSPSLQTPPKMPPANENLASLKSSAPGSVSSAPANSTPAYSTAANSALATGSTMMAGDGSRSALLTNSTAIPAGAPTSSLTGSRYANSDSLLQQETPSGLPVAPVAVTPTAVVAVASPYRPGGTATYAGSAELPGKAGPIDAGTSAVEIASRPNPVETQVPNVATPGLAPEPSQAPRYR